VNWKLLSDRVRCLAAWPLLVVGTPLLLAAKKLGGEGIRYALADTWEQLCEKDELKQPRPAAPELFHARDSRRG
jgi:hypothetical protein